MRSTDTPSAHAPRDSAAAERVKARARDLGFSLVGIAAADEPLGVEFERYEAALEEGLHGPIEYLAENVEARRRLDRQTILEGARSVVVVAARYDRPDESNDPPLARTIARYARGRDYHQHLRKRLRSLAAFIRSLAAGTRARPMVDTAPVLERAWAARAGIGFVGKNGIVMAPGVGSYLLLGEVATTLALAVDAPIEERCGRCTLCLDACPTGAFPRPFVLDAGKCVSTMTIELHGPVPEALREATSTHLFGCDICQEVCPHNAKARSAPPLSARYRPDSRWADVRLEDLARLGMPGAPSFEALTSGSPVRRAGAEGLARNACMRIGREGGPGRLELLREIRDTHPSSVVRDAAAWGVSRLEAKRGP